MESSNWMGSPGGVLALFDPRGLLRTYYLYLDEPSLNLCALLCCHAVSCCVPLNLCYASSCYIVLNLNVL